MPAFFEGDWPNATPRSSNIPARVIHWPLGNEGEEIVELIAPRARLSPGVFPQLVACVDEVITNALTHSNSPIDCIVVGQAFPETQKIELAILDLGQSILSHLRVNPKYSHIASDEAAILKAMEDGVTGTPDGKRNSRGQVNSGAGLAFIRNHCESGGGELTVLSGNRWVVYTSESLPILGTFTGKRFGGCLVNVRFFVDSGLPRTDSQPIL